MDLHLRGSNPLAPTITPRFHYPSTMSTEMSTSKSGPTDYFGLTIPFLDYLGVVPEHAVGGKSRISVDLRPELENSFHVAHGGLIMTLLDFAMAAAVRSSADHPLGAITIDMTTSFLRPTVGKIVVEGNTLKSGKVINYCEAVVLNEAGEITAKASGSFTLRR